MKSADEGHDHFEPRVPGVDYGVLDRLLGYALRRAQLLLYEDFVASLATWNITPPRFSAMVVIAQNPDLKLTELARILGVARSGAVTLIDALSALGFVVRHDSPTDKRAFRLALTSKGKRALEAMTKAVEAHDKRIVSMLSEPEQAQLMQLLRRMAGLRE
jgi:DNA-binding MarR family transcriptional regulator